MVSWCLAGPLEDRAHLCIKLSDEEEFILEPVGYMRSGRERNIYGREGSATDITDSNMIWAQGVNT